MTAIFSSDDVPDHVLTIPELSFAEDLFAERVGTPWLRLGAWTITSHRDGRGVEEEIFRQTVLLSPKAFPKIFDKLVAGGKVIGDLGKPGGSVWNSPDKNGYYYSAFHQFSFPFPPVTGEALVFVRWDTAGTHLFINPDLWLFFELEEKPSGSGTWWDPRRGVEALHQRIVDGDTLEIVEIRTEYLLKYLQARQMTLLVGHYRQLLMFDPEPSKIRSFVKKDVTIGSSDQGMKAILNNWGFREDGEFLQRRLHLWFEIEPPSLDLDDPWSDPPSFDPYSFTLPTRSGFVAPGRWRHFRKQEGRTFDGEVCEFMDRVYFRQEVLIKYEGASGFEVGDNGSVRCNYWGLVRSTSRIGNELIATGIGDFAEGVTLEEWPHWRQYAVEPPSQQTLQDIISEQAIPDAVNLVVDALHELNHKVAALADSLVISTEGIVWSASADSLAGRQLKWVYPVTADDDEFLKRATLLSTLVIEGFESSVLRKLLKNIGDALHLNNDNPPRSLGSRNLIQRLTLISILIEKLKPEIEEIPLLVKQAEGEGTNSDKEHDMDLGAELKHHFQTLRGELSPLAFLYDLRTHGGIAHTLNRKAVAVATKRLGLSESNWHRRDYLTLLNVVQTALGRINEHLWAAALSNYEFGRKTLGG